MNILRDFGKHHMHLKVDFIMSEPPHVKFLFLLTSSTVQIFEFLTHDIFMIIKIIATIKCSPVAHYQVSKNQIFLCFVKLLFSNLSNIPTKFTPLN